MFIGQYEHQIDEKGRIRIPARFKEELGENPYIFCGSNNCLFVYPAAEANRVLFNKLGDDKFSNEKSNMVRRIIASSGIVGEEDKQGRVLLSAKLLAHAGITKNIVSVGAINRIEIWSEELWREYDKQNDIASCLKLLDQDTTDTTK